MKNIEAEEKKPRLLLHCCCAPCSSSVFECLTRYFEITAFYYNPNIEPESEFLFRLDELKRLVSEMPETREVAVAPGNYEPARFRESVKGFENEPEGGRRCDRCFALRLGETAKRAAEEGFDFFTTTLTVSPLKNAAMLNEIGEQAAGQYGVRFLNADFKKKDGYKRSIELSKAYHLYRQNYCGCIFSRSAGKE